MFEEDLDNDDDGVAEKTVTLSVADGLSYFIYVN